MKFSNYQKMESFGRRNSFHVPVLLFGIVVLFFVLWFGFFVLICSLISFVDFASEFELVLVKSNVMWTQSRKSVRVGDHLFVHFSKFVLALTKSCSCNHANSFGACAASHRTRCCSEDAARQIIFCKATGHRRCRLGVGVRNADESEQKLCFCDSTTSSLFAGSCKFLH